MAWARRPQQPGGNRDPRLLGHGRYQKEKTQEWGANHRSAGNKGRSFQAPGKRKQHGSDHTMPNTGRLHAQWSARSPYICLTVLLGIWYSFGSSSKGILTFIKWQSCVSCERIILSPYFLRSTLCSQFERQKRTNGNGSSSGAGVNNSSTYLSRYHSRPPPAERTVAQDWVYG